MKMSVNRPWPTDAINNGSPQQTVTHTHTHRTHKEDRQPTTGEKKIYMRVAFTGFLHNKDAGRRCWNRFITEVEDDIKSRRCTMLPCRRSHWPTSLARARCGCFHQLSSTHTPQWAQLNGRPALQHNVSAETSIPCYGTIWMCINEIQVR